MQPDAFRVFAFYHLGFDDAWRYRFRNLHHAAEAFRMPVPELKAYLVQHRLDAETAKMVHFNISRAHADAQELDLTGAPPDAREAFSRVRYQEYLAAVASYAGVPAPDDVTVEELEAVLAPPAKI